MFLLLFSYVALFSFILISLFKAYKFSKMPLSGRLDLYPVPKEKGRSEYGGSYYEEVKWWQKPRQVSFWGEVKDMLHEMLFIKKLFENQKPLWWISYSLHLGIYLLIGWTGLLFIGALTELSGLAITDSNLWSTLVYYLTLLTGVAGAFMVTFGSAALFVKRISVESFKKYTAPQDLFNLSFIFLTTVTGLLVWLQDPVFNYGRVIATSMLTFSPIEASGMLALHIVLLGTLIIYIPLTKMSHYVGKYFSFHKILWGNDPNVPGSAIEAQVKAGAGFKPTKTWSAPHYQPTQNTTKEM